MNINASWAPSYFRRTWHVHYFLQPQTTKKMHVLTLSAGWPIVEVDKETSKRGRRAKREFVKTVPHRDNLLIILQGGERWDYSSVCALTQRGEYLTHSRFGCSRVYDKVDDTKLENSSGLHDLHWAYVLNVSSKPFFDLSIIFGTMIDWRDVVCANIFSVILGALKRVCTSTMRRCKLEMLSLPVWAQDIYFTLVMGSTRLDISTSIKLCE